MAVMGRMLLLLLLAVVAVVVGGVAVTRTGGGNMGESGRSGIVVEREQEREREGVVVVGIGIMPRLRLGGAVISGDVCFLPSLSLSHTHFFILLSLGALGYGVWEGGVQGLFSFGVLLRHSWLGTAVPDGLHGCKLASSSLEFKGCYWIGFMGYTDLPDELDIVWLVNAGGRPVSF